MRVWAHIDNAAGDLLSAGPLRNLRAVSVTRAMDGAGSIRLETFGSDERALELLQVERRATLYVHDEASGTRVLGRGIITNLGAQDTSSGWTRTASGPDMLHGLKSISTGRGLLYDNQQVQDIVDDLLGKVSGWTGDCDVTDLFTVRFDGESILAALQAVTGAMGLHLREALDTPGTLEVGAFGTVGDLRVINKTQMSLAAEANPDVVFIERFSVVDDSEALCNRVVPFGAGLGESDQGLILATLSSPYTVQSATVNGQTVYYLEDATSVSTYGLKEKYLKIDGIAPLANSATAQELAGNSLYNVAANYLARRKDPQQTYRVTVRGLRGHIVQPGDKIHVRYKGVVRNDSGVLVDYRDVNGDFWVLRVTERIGVEGYAMDLDISNLDRWPDDPAEVIIGEMESLKLSNTRVKPYFNGDTTIIERMIDPDHDVTQLLDFTDMVQRAVRIRLKLRTKPLRTPVDEMILMQSPGSDGSGPWYYRELNFRDAVSDSTQQVLIPTTIETDPIQITTGLSPVSSWEITDDVVYPSGISIEISGQTVSGGPWGLPATPLSATIDVTSYFEDAAGGLQQEHDIVISCTDGRGMVELEIERYMVIQAIAVS
jgi:hypothetical protein